MSARRGGLSIVGVILAASAGSLAGAILWYYIGRWIGNERLHRWAERKGKYIGFSPKDIDRADSWFDRYGGAAVFFGRMIPGIRTLVSVPAGISGMPFGRFLAFSAAGTGLWSTALALVGWWLGQSAQMVEQAISWAGIAVIVLIVAWIARRVWKAKSHHRNRKGEDRSRDFGGTAMPSR
jgi:membrane protein DedA with SNARE-associated domain